ncbi:MAG: hypothetical protein BWY76_03022 [bacterium ADurb.Bin429]|nr:MAG: hypothetical protein BWY76_03022 [bacterium ADurb.Bin429]
MGEQVLQRAVLLQQLRRGLLADAGHAGDVIRRVAGKRLHIGNLHGSDAVALHHTGSIILYRIGQAFFIHQHVHGIIYKLKSIAVGGDDERLPTFRFSAAGEGADDVIRLEAFDTEHGNAHRLQHLVGHGLAVRLVVFIRFMAEGGGGHVKSDGDIIRLHLIEEHHHHLRETVDGIRYLPLLIRERGQREEGAVKQAVGINNGDFWCWHDDFHRVMR